MLNNTIKTILKSIVVILCLNIITGCENDHYYDKTFRDVIVGSYRIGSYNENITFEENGSFWMESEDNEYIDDCYGDYHVDQYNNNNIICTYIDPEDDEEYTDTMKLISFIGSEKSIKVKNVPMHHNGEEIVLTKK